jgi:alkylation response protein AidB-like acyl-CoA dehydrogenase
MFAPDISVDELAAQARSWLAAHAQGAPPDYGAILPVHLFERGMVWQKTLSDAGWVGLDFPVEFGGHGLSAEHRAVWVRECALAGVPPFLNMVGFVLACGSTLLYGTPEQKAAVLGPTMRADRVWCQLFSEPGAGSDLASLSTRAIRDGDDYVISGQKVWCSGGRYSNWGILLARTDPDATKHRGISFFLLDMTLPGIDIRPLRQMTGEAEFDEVFFDDVRIPASALLGPLHGGWGVAMATLTNERGSIGTAAISLGRRMNKMVDELRSAADTANTAGDGLGAVETDELMRVMTTGRTLVWLASRQGPVASTASSLTKLAMTELGFSSASARVAISGAHAMLDDDDAMQSLLSAPGGRIAGGTSQIQRNLIGERLLGLPAEPRPQS